MLQNAMMWFNGWVAGAGRDRGRAIPSGHPDIDGQLVFLQVGGSWNDG